MAYSPLRMTEQAQIHDVFSHSMRPIEEAYGHDPANFDDSFMLEPQPQSRAQAGFRRCWRLLTKTAVHLPPIAITIGTLSLTFRQNFWTAPSSNTNTILNLLQFAAQLHGSLIVLSLSTIVFHLLSFRLRSSRGLPLGLLSSSFQLNSLSYLFSSEFWGSWKSKGNRDGGYIAVFLFIFSLAFACQPSSAIAMIPRLQFWPVAEIHPGNSIRYQAYIQANEQTLYPRVLTADDAPRACARDNTMPGSRCPSQGINDIIANDVLFSMGSNTAQPLVNVTIESGWRRQVIGQGGSVNVGIQSSYTARTLSNFLGQALFYYNSLLFSFGNPHTNIPNIQRSNPDLLSRYDLSFRSGSTKIPTKKPSVEVECSGFRADATEISFPQNFGAPAVDAWVVPSSQYQDLSVDVDVGAVNFTWIDVTQFKKSKPSLLGIFATPTVYSGYFTTSSSKSSDYLFTFYACTIDARWEATEVFYDDSTGSPTIYDSYPNGETAQDAFDRIQINPGFAAYLSAPYVEGSIEPKPTNKSIMQAIGDKCVLRNTVINATIFGTPFPDNQSHHVVEDPMAMLGCFQVSLSTYLADGLARIQDNVPAYFLASGRYRDGDHEEFEYIQGLYDSESITGFVTNASGLTEADLQDSSRFVEISMPLKQYGYGYGFAESRLIYVGAAILLLHVAICLVHIVWMAITDRSEGLNWDTLGELIAILLRTSVAERGVPLLRSKSNWKDRFVVKEMTDDEKSSFDGRLTSSDAKPVKRKPITLMMKRLPNGSGGSK